MRQRRNLKPDPAWTKHYQHGVKPRIIPPTESLAEMFARSVQQAGKKTATVFFDAKTSYKALGDQVSRAANSLRRMGVRPGDRVAVLLPNCPQHLVAMYAIWRIGAVLVEHNPLYTQPELETMFADHDARVAIAMDSVVPKLKKMPRNVRPRTIVSVNLLHALPKLKRMALSLPLPKLRKMRAQLSSGDRGSVTWEEMLSAKPISNRVPYPQVNSLAAIQYTSGTTGKPKGAMLTHFNLYSNALQGAAWMRGAETGKETSYAALPMFHSFGITMHATFGVLKQMRQVLFPKPDTDMIVSAMKKYPATVYCVVPILYQRTAETARKRGVSLKSCKYCISGAAALPDSTRTLWEKVSGGLLVEGYGLTEASPVALGNPFWKSRRPGTIGIPFPSTLMKVVDDEGNQVPPNTPGELLLQGPQITQGYWHDREATEQVLKDGWLHTGDVVTADEDGFVTIVARKKEIIVTGGFNVSPAEVEEVLNSHEGVVESCVVGLPTERGDEEVVAAVVLKRDVKLDTEETRNWLKKQLAAYKVPRKFFPVDEIPKSMLGKALRKQTRDQILSNL